MVSESGLDRTKMIQPEVMVPPLLWLVSDTAGKVTGRRFLAAGAKSISVDGAAAGNSGYVWVLKLTLADGTVYTITPSSGTIEGAATYVVADVEKPTVTFVSDGVSDLGLWA